MNGSGANGTTKRHGTRRIRLNVGGTVFETSESTLCRIPGTVLATICEERWDNGKTDAEVFIDRDSTHFRLVLNFLRDGATFVLPKDPNAISELRREAVFFQIDELVELCSEATAPLRVGDTVTWAPEALSLYWRPFVRYIVDDSLSLPFIYDRNNHILAKCIACEEFQDPKCSYLFDINYDDWEPMRHHMVHMKAEVTQLMGEQCCVVAWDNGQQIHLPKSALQRVLTTAV